MRSGHYRCSSGLVLDALGERRTCTVLGERNGLTRAQLEQQIADEALPSVHVIDDARAVDRHAASVVGTSLLAHVDPFALTAELWSSISPALERLAACATESIFVVYSYTRAASSAWPAAPARTIGPIAQVRANSHEVAVYASVGMEAAVREVCGSLGFRLS